MKAWAFILEEFKKSNTEGSLMLLRVTLVSLTLFQLANCFFFTLGWGSGVLEHSGDQPYAAAAQWTETFTGESCSLHHFYHYIQLILTPPSSLVTRQYYLPFHLRHIIPSRLVLLIKPYNNSGYSFNFCYKKIIQQTIWVVQRTKWVGMRELGHSCLWMKTEWWDWTNRAWFTVQGVLIQ